MTGHLSEAELARMRRRGMAPIGDAQGLELFDAAIQSGEPLSLATPLELSALRARARAGELPALFAGLVRTPTRRRGAASSLAQRLANTPTAEREAMVLELVRGEAATVLGHPSPAAIEPTRAFKELGFDSLAAVELRNRLKAATGLRLPSTLVFDHPSVAAVASYLREQVGDGAGAAVAVRAVASEEPVAIIGMACRYPGGVASPRGALGPGRGRRRRDHGFPPTAAGTSSASMTPIPTTSGTSYAREGGFIADVAGFDAEFFDISPREALAMDPQQRLLAGSLLGGAGGRRYRPGLLARRAAGFLPES